jgi:hypothetical protein
MGLTPLEPGYARIGLKPCLAAFDRFEASCQTTAGAVRVRWEKTALGAYRLQAQVPSGVRTVIRVGANTYECDATFEGVLSQYEDTHLSAL